MKLLACHIENFGKLSNLSFQFQDGINVIHQPNGWGKSTFAVFLKVMFYGFDSKKETGAFEKERVLYRPWQGGVFGGELDFEVNGKAYRISRTFGRTEKTDEFHLYDLYTNLESSDYSTNIGMELFDLDSASFKRTIFIGQNDCNYAVSDCINAKLGNLAENTDDMNNFESAIQHLKGISNHLTPDRVTGSIKKRKNTITHLTQELRMLDSAQEGFDAVKEKIKDVSIEIEELSEARQNYGADLVIASEESRKKELRKQYDALCKDVEEKETHFSKLKPIFPNGVPTKEELKEQMQNVRNMQDCKARLEGWQLTTEEQEVFWEELEHMFENGVPEKTEINASLEQLASAEKQKENLTSLKTHMNFLNQKLEEELEVPVFEKMTHKIPLFVGGATILAGIFVFVLWYMQIFSVANEDYLLISVLFAVLFGTACMTIGFIQVRRGKKEKELWQMSVKNEYEELESRYKELEKQATETEEQMQKVYETVGAFLGRFRVTCNSEEYSAKLYELKNQLSEYERLWAKLKESEKEQQILETETQKVDAFLETYACEKTQDYLAVLSYYQEKAAEFLIAESSYQEACAKQEEFEKNQEASFWAKMVDCPYTIEELNQKIQETDRKIEERKKAKAHYEKQYESLQEQLDLRDEKQAELEEQLCQQEEDRKKYTIVKLTQEYLTKAKEQFTARYMDPIANAFTKYYEMLTGDTQKLWSIDANINLKLKELGELREIKWFSAGSQDLLGVCMRLALVDVMYQVEKPFLILDDPFVNLDEEKTKAGNQLLPEVAKEYQIVYFTCHDSRMSKKMVCGDEN